MTARYLLPNAATKYILFQRTDYLRLNRSLPFRLFRKIVPGMSYRRSVQVESTLRRTQIKRMYLADMESEYLSIKKYLPAECSSILDVGCGVAGIDLFLAEHYADHNVEVILLDKSEISDDLYYLFERTPAFYNSLSIAKQLLVANGVAEESVTLLEVNDDNTIEVDRKIDLVLSLISWGFHYPVDTYLSQVHELLSDHGVLILDVRKGTNGTDLIAQQFTRYEIILDARKHQRICATK